MIQLNWIFLGFGVLINIIIIMCVLTYYISPFHLNGIFKIIIVLIDCLICEENSAFWHENNQRTSFIKIN